MPTNAQLCSFPSRPLRLVLANIYALGAEFFACLCYLLHELGMCFRYVIEGEDAPTEAEEKVGAEGDKSPEGDLLLGSARH